jgi:hypothetical protein
MEEAEFEVWRRHLRQVFYEQLVIQNAFAVQLLAGRLSVDEAEQLIKEGLDVTSARSDALFGELLRDPALTALYADEVKFLSPAIPSAERCIATVASSGFESLLDDMLGSLSTNGGCEDALLVVFCAGNPETVAPVVAKYRARLIQCRPIRPVGLTLKSVLYSVARVVDAEQYLCLDADMLVLRDLRPLFAMLHACPEGSILVCRENNSRRFRNLGDAFVRLYQGSPVEGSTLLDERLASYPLVVNDGLFAGTRAALLALDSTVRGMPQMQAWMDDRPEIRFRNQFIFNSALAESNCGIELDPVYNLQLQGCEMRMFREAGRIQAEWKNKRVAVAHFNGDGRHKYPEFRNRHSLMLNASPGT